MHNTTYHQYQKRKKSKFLRRFSPDLLRDTYFRLYAQRKLEKVMGKVTDTSQVLEVGAGTGLYSALIQERFPGAKIVNVDNSNEFLECNPNLLKINADAHSLPFGDSTFEVVFCVDVLHHVDHPAQVVKEMTRVAQETVFFIEPNLYNPPSFWWYLMNAEERGLFRIPYFRLKKMIAAYGGIVSITHVEFFPYFKPIVNKWTYPLLNTLEKLCQVRGVKWLSGSFVIEVIKNEKG